jgi:hypothetical protein
VICDDAVAIGFAAVFKLCGKKFSSIKLHRNDKGKTICYKSSTVKVGCEVVTVNPSLFFNRKTCILNDSSMVKDFLVMNWFHSYTPLMQQKVLWNFSSSTSFVKMEVTFFRLRQFLLQWTPACRLHILQMTELMHVQSLHKGITILLYHLIGWSALFCYLFKLLLLI